MRGRMESAVETPARAGSRARSRGASALARALVGGLALAGALCGARQAAAQTNTSTSTTSTSTTSPLTPLRSQNGVITMYPNNQGIDRKRPAYTQTRPWWISYDDCISKDGDNGDVFTFSLSTTSSNDNLEIWAGTENCATNRNNLSLIGQCWMVGFKNLNEDTVQVDVPVRNVLARRTGVASLPGPLGEDVCDNSTEVNGEAISWYFMVVKGGQAAEYFAWNGAPGGTGIDVVGPSPPGAISVGVGESQLTIKMRNVPTDATRERYEAFCVPADTTYASLGLADAGVSSSGGVASLLDGGIDLDASTSGTSTSGISDAAAAPSECPTDLLVSGQRPPPITQSQFSCGTTNSISGTLRTSGRLANNRSYAVAVSGQDVLGNAGAISTIQCGTPIVLQDFYELYSSRGGPGGGGFCSFSPERRSTGAGSAGLVVLVLAGLGWRRSRGRA
jgi:hypothetical protein